jgi:phospholipid/cholesterol/gamma-HCH transport system substrate-binding protein
MKKKTVNHAKLGIFVLSGIVFLALTLYMIGKNRNLLGSTFTIHALVANVNGLVTGNNVRYKGIDVGTVKAIDVISDSSILVSMTIDKRMKPFISKNAITSIGTDGLMGNKLININSVSGHSFPVDAGDTLRSREPVETDEMIRTLNTTNNNLARITANLYEISDKLNNSSSLWSLLSDTVVSQDIRQAVSGFKRAGAGSAAMTERGARLIGCLEQGDGVVNRAFTDTVMSNSLAGSIDDVRNATSQLKVVASELQDVLTSVRVGNGPAELLLYDSAFRGSLSRSVTHIEEGTMQFNENMKAMRTNFLFRKYFKRQAKAARKNP